MADAAEEENQRLRALIEQANEPSELEQAREELIRLIQNDDWEVVHSASLRRDDSPGQEGYLAILRRLGVQYPSEGAMVAYVLDLLKSNFPMHAVGLGEPLGSLGIGWVMNNSDGRDLYIKLTIQEQRMGQPRARFLSFHRSIHARK
jgi:hypothetical protein